jgi:hypothetical protein
MIRLTSLSSRHWLTLFWAVSGLLLSLAYEPMTEDFIAAVLYGLLWITWIIGGLGLLARALWVAWRHRWPRSSIALAAATVAVGAATFASFPTLAATGQRWLLESRLARFGIIVAELQRRESPVSGVVEEKRARYIVEPGPVLRVAFILPGGILDNWRGLIYDPSGQVLEAQRFRKDWSNWDDPELAAIKAMFGGDMRNCRHVRGAWHLCLFT